jgi:addiction module HigA family antidote
MNKPPHPGESLWQDVVYCSFMSVIDAAAYIRVPFEDLDQICDETAPMTLEIAQALEKAGFGTAQAWMALQEAYDKAQRGEG